MGLSFTADQVVDEAIARAGHDRVDAMTWREGLDVLTADAAHVAYTEAGDQRMHTNLVDLLATRLKVAEYLADRPELEGRTIERPVFVFGIPRTGTTLLSNLLACDPARRSPLTWEIDDPVPPATSATLKTDPRAVARLAQEKAMLAARPEMGKYYRNSAIYPNECMFVMIQDLKGLALESRGRLPGYRDWLLSTDMTSAYTYHRKFLALLQSEAPGTWNLKMPSHALWLDTIRQVFPDARFVWTHRDPFTAMGSFCSIITMGHTAFTGAPDRPFIGENCTYQAGLHADRIMDYRDANGQDSMVDVHYDRLMTDPIGTMRALYAGLGDDFTPEAEAAMQAWLDDNPQGKFGKHEYQLEQYGLSVEQLRPVFERYLSSYDIAREG